MKESMIPKKIILVFTFVLCLYPLWILFAYSFSRQISLIMFPIRLFPLNASFANYKAIFSTSDVPRWAINTIVLVSSVTLLSTLVSAMTGYVFALYNFKGKRILWALLLFGIMVPRIALIIPLFVVTAKMKISGTLAACIFPVLLSPVNIYLARNYFNTIPKSIIEAARIDGAGDIGILVHVGIPLCGPIMAALSLGSAIGAMGDWIWQALQLQDTNVQTLLVGLMRLALRHGALVLNTLGRQMACGIILLVPIIAVFCFANKYFVSSLGGAIKE